jgi:hypothetical protein
VKSIKKRVGSQIFSIFNVNQLFKIIANIASDNISAINSTDINKEQMNGTFLTVKEGIILLFNNNN